MKKIFFLFVTMLVIGFSVPASAEEPVPPAPGITKDEAQAIVNQLKAIQKENKKFSGVATRFEENSRAYVEVGRSQAEAIRSVGEKIDTAAMENRGAMSNLQRNIQAGREDNWNEFQNLGSQNVKNTWIVGCLLGVILVVIAGLLWLFHRSQKSKLTEILTAQKVSPHVLDTFYAKLSDIPKETVKTIRKFDTTPFEFKVAGHQVCYTSPITDEGVYRLLHVPKDLETDDPATFEMLVEDSRGRALSSIRGTMKKFFEGKFNTETPQGKLQIALIEHLKTTGAIKID